MKDEDERAYRDSLPLGWRLAYLALKWALVAAVMLAVAYFIAWPVGEWVRQTLRFLFGLQ